MPVRAVCAALPAPGGALLAPVRCIAHGASSRSGNAMLVSGVASRRMDEWSRRRRQQVAAASVSGTPCGRMYTARRVQNQAIKQSSNKSTNPPRPSSFDIMPCNDAAPPPALARRPLPLEGQKARRSKFLSLGACTPCPQRKLPNLNGDKKEAAHQGCSHSGRPRS